MTDTKDETVYQDFKDTVTMTAGELEKWLRSDESRSVGVKSGTASDKKTSAGGSESTGHESGRKIIAILKKKKSELTNADYEQMKRVNAYVKRHLAQRPHGDIADSRWRYSLMNWGNDPVKG